MSSFLQQSPDIVVAIAGGASQGPIQNNLITSGDSDAIIIMAPASAEASTIQVSHDGVTFFALQNKTVAVAGPAAGAAEVYGAGINPPIIAPYWRLAFAGAVAAQRTYKVWRRSVLNQ